LINVATISDFGLRVQMQRRNFIKAVAFAATGIFPAGAQLPAMPVIGFLDSGSPDNMATNLAGFIEALLNPDVQGKNVAVDQPDPEGRMV
jgi:hypothetical protein